jgi:hypothetical protein
MIRSSNDGSKFDLTFAGCLVRSSEHTMSGGDKQTSEFAFVTTDKDDKPRG